jgi:hypothetical protein
MRSTSGIFVVVAAVLSAALSACSSTIHDTARIGGYSTLSIDAKQRLVLFGNRPGTDERMVCAEPSPDAIVAMSAALAASGSASIPVTPGEAAKDTITAGFGASSSESAASIAMRTATVQVLRDGYYRLCEGMMSGSIQPDQYRLVLSGIGDFIATVMAIDSAGGTKHAPAVTINGGSVSATADPNTAKVNVVGATGPTVAGQPPGMEIGEIAVSTPDDKEAVAIKDIVASYLRHIEYLRRIRSGRY